MQFHHERVATSSNDKAQHGMVNFSFSSVVLYAIRNYCNERFLGSNMLQPSQGTKCMPKCQPLHRHPSKPTWDRRHSKLSGHEWGAGTHSEVIARKKHVTSKLKRQDFRPSSYPSRHSGTMTWLLTPDSHFNPAYLIPTYKLQSMTASI